MNSLFSAANGGGGQLGQFALGPHNPLGGPELISAKEVGESR